ncbi:MAG: hypothetical protein U1F35_23030 [Steroidobacteraceae bacterium]
MRKLSEATAHAPAPEPAGGHLPAVAALGLGSRPVARTVYTFDAQRETSRPARMLRTLSEQGIDFRGSAYLGEFAGGHFREPGAGVLVKANYYGMRTLYRFEMARWLRTLVRRASSRR